MKRLLLWVKPWWAWLPLPLSFAAGVVIQGKTSVTFSADVFFWSFSTAIQGVLAALAVAALIGWEQTTLLRDFIREILEKKVSPKTAETLRASGVSIPMSEVIGAIDHVLSGKHDASVTTQRDMEFLRLARARAASLQKLQGLLMSQVFATAAAVIISLVCLALSEALSGTWVGTVSVSAAIGLGLTCVLLTVLVAHYSVGRGRGKP
jgi:hypothetical protein